MSIATRALKPLALTTALLAVTAGLALSPLAVTSASAASATSSAASILSSINHYRDTQGVDPLVPNGFVKNFAQEYAVGMAKKNSLSGAVHTKTAYPDGADNGGGPIVKVPHGTAASVYKYLRSFDTYEYGSEDFNYGAVGYATHGTTVYAVVVLLHYDVAPLDLLTEGTPSISGTAKVGSPLTAKVSLSPSGSTVTWVWKVGGVVEGTNSNTFTPAASDLGKKITVSASAVKSGFVSTAVHTSASTKAVAHGSLVKHTVVIAGHRNVGQTLTATSAPWGPGSVPLTWKWTRSGKTIADATSSTYLLVAADKGKKIDAVATGTLDGYTTASVSTATKVLTGSPLLTATPVPTVTGTATVGQVLTVTAGDWQPAPVVLTYQWKVGGTSVSHATKTTFTVPTTAVGKTITVTVTGTKSGYTTASETSVSTTSVQSIPFTTVGTPSISGAFAKGKVLKASVGTWAPTPTFSYQWLRNGVAISKATKSTYTLVTADLTATISVRVTGKKTGYTTAVVVSAATGAV